MLWYIYIQQNYIFYNIDIYDMIYMLYKNRLALGLYVYIRNKQKKISWVWWWLWMNAFQMLDTC